MSRSIIGSNSAKCWLPLSLGYCQLSRWMKGACNLELTAFSGGCCYCWEALHPQQSQ